jgi:dipeptide/tripeptide permease
MVNIIVWILQILLALHTGIGALWKFSHTAQETMPTIAAISEPVWIGLGVLELVCVVLLLLPLLKKRTIRLAALAAGIIAAEMFVFCTLHLSSESTDRKPLIYWGVAAALCIFVAIYRLRVHAESK